jgi:hypothetical protein
MKTTDAVTLCLIEKTGLRWDLAYTLLRSTQDYDDFEHHLATLLLQRC